MQHDYLAAYAACVDGDLARARASSRARWRDHPVDRWRHRFGALLAMLDEVGRAPRPRSSIRAAASSSTPRPRSDAAGVRARGRSRRRACPQPARRRARAALLRDGRRAAVLAPAVRRRATSSRFSFIEPGHREQLAAAAGRASRRRGPPRCAARTSSSRRVGAGHAQGARSTTRTTSRPNVAHQYRPGPRAARVGSRRRCRRRT